MFRPWKVFCWFWYSDLFKVSRSENWLYMSVLFGVWWSPSFESNMDLQNHVKDVLAKISRGRQVAFMRVFMGMFTLWSRHERLFFLCARSHLWLCSAGCGSSGWQRRGVWDIGEVCLSLSKTSTGWRQKRFEMWERTCNGVHSEFWRF